MKENKAKVTVGKDLPGVPKFTTSFLCTSSSDDTAFICHPDDLIQMINLGKGARKTIQVSCQISLEKCIEPECLLYFVEKPGS